MYYIIRLYVVVNVNVECYLLYGMFCVLGILF